MRNDVFVYLKIYSVYLEIYENGEVVQGVRFPDVIVNMCMYIVQSLLRLYSSTTTLHFS